MYAEYAGISGVAGLSLDSTVDLDWAANVLQPQLAVQGNLDPEALVAGGELLRQSAGRILHKLGRGPLIFNLGHGILPETPPEHVAALVDQVHGWHG
jgi:uroporphyrinogen decarboxylase